MTTEQIKQAFREYTEKQNEMLNYYGRTSRRCASVSCHENKNGDCPLYSFDEYNVIGKCFDDELRIGKSIDAIDIVMNWQPPVDWSKVAVDTPILVSGNNELWHKGYFAGYDAETGNVAIWKAGATSWSVVHEGLAPDRCWWKHAKLAEEEQT